MSKKDKDIFGETEKHPAFGVVSFSRVTGGGKVFFGSDVPSDHYITLEINQASRRHNLGSDWIGESGSLPLIQVAMTSHQFAELLTSLNVGSGVPCTIQYFNGKNIERLEKIETEGDRIKKHFKEQSKERADELVERMNQVREMLAKDKISKADRKAIEGLMDSITQEYKSSQPFYLDQFEESTEKLIVQAKAEVDAFVTHVVVNAGLEHLRGLKTQAKLPTHDTTRDIKEKQIGSRNE
jgi:hypothetical protein